MSKNFVWDNGLKKWFVKKSHNLDKYDRAEIIVVMVAIIACLIFFSYYQRRIDANTSHFRNERVNNKSQLFSDSARVKNTRIPQMTTF